MEVHHRQDRAGDQVPVGRELEGHHRLDVEIGPLDVLLHADTTVVVELERHADQRGHRVGQLLGQAGLLGAQHLGCFLPLATTSGWVRGLGDHGLVGLNRRNASAAGGDCGGSGCCREQWKLRCQGLRDWKEPQNQTREPKGHSP